MRTLSSYLDEYEVSHRHPVNVKLHTVCVPLILWSTVGFFHTFTLGQGNLRPSHLLALFALGFYASLRNLKMLLAMALMLAVIFASFPYVPELFWASIIVFVVAWIGQFYGHKVEGRKPSFFKDLLFLLIGPVWVIHKFIPLTAPTTAQGPR